MELKRISTSEEAATLWLFLCNLYFWITILLISVSYTQESGKDFLPYKPYLDGSAPCCLLLMEE